MFGTTNYSQNRSNGGFNSGVNVNSAIKVSSSEDSRFRYGIWNQQITLTINPAIGRDPQTGLPAYDNNRSAKAYMNMSCAKALKYKIDSNITPELNKYMKGEPFSEASAGIECGSTKKNVINIELKNIDNKPVIRLAIYGPLNENNVADQSLSMIHTFPVEVVMGNYDVVSGKSDITNDVSGDFLIFCDVLDSVINMTPMVDHGSRYNRAVASNYGGGNNGGFHQNSSQPNNNQGSNYGSAGSWGSTAGTNMDELPFS